MDEGRYRRHGMRSADRHDVTRRRFLRLAAAGAAAAPVVGALGMPRAAATARAGPDPSAVVLTAKPTTIDLGGRTARTWAYGDTVPGPQLRVAVGETLRVRLINKLPDPTTVHFHGIRLPNRVDGVPDLPLPAVAPGEEFLYEFENHYPGTYFFHPHVGLQLDRGLYGVLIVDDPNEAGAYDQEWVVVLDDWTDGVGPTPDALLAALGPAPGSSHGEHTSTAVDDVDRSRVGRTNSALLGGHGGDVGYPLMLANGRPPNDPETFAAAPGQRIRLRLVNAAAETAFRVALGGHEMTVTHTDGYPVEPVTGDAVLLSMGERVDAVVTAGDGVFPLVAVAEGKRGRARALLRTGTGTAPRVSARPDELDGRVLTVEDFAAAPAAVLAERPPDIVHRLVLRGTHRPYRWTINNRTFAEAEELITETGQRVRLAFVNASPMFHPMHVHGHTFAVLRDGQPGVRKDTVLVRPNDTVRVDLDADNAGYWALHCHNAYHQEAGMMTVLYYSGA